MYNQLLIERRFAIVKNTISSFRKQCKTYFNNENYLLIQFKTNTKPFKKEPSFSCLIDLNIKLGFILFETSILLIEKELDKNIMYLNKT